MSMSNAPTTVQSLDVRGVLYFTYPSGDVALYSGGAGRIDVVDDTVTAGRDLWNIRTILTDKLTCSPIAAPTAAEGMIYYDSTANKLKVYNGAAWETITSA